jgi:hypothetical protein
MTEEKAEPFEEGEAEPLEEVVVEHQKTASPWGVVE